MKTFTGLAAAIFLSCAASVSFAQMTPTTPSTPPAATTPATEEGRAVCRTRKPEGEACACLSDTSRVGVSKTNPDSGRNECVMSAS
jgi:hypothetical protein